MTVGQKVRARFTTFSALAEHERPKKNELYPIRDGVVTYIHPRGRFLLVQTHARGGDIVESFRPDEVWT